MTKQRRHFSGPEKVAALKRPLVEKVPVSDLCDELGIAPNLFYRWQKAFFDNGHTAFDNGRVSSAPMARSSSPRTSRSSSASVA